MVGVVLFWASDLVGGGENARAENHCTQSHSAKCPEPVTLWVADGRESMQLARFSIRESSVAEFHTCANLQGRPAFPRALIEKNTDRMLAGTYVTG